MPITATISSIKTEGGQLRVVLDYSDGTQEAFMIATSATIDDIQLRVAQLLSIKNNIVYTLADLSQYVGTVIAVTGDDQISVAVPGRATETVSTLPAAPIKGHPDPLI